MKKLFTLIVLSLSFMMVTAQRPAGIAKPMRTASTLQKAAPRTMEAMRLQAPTVKAATLVEVPDGAQVETYTPSGTLLGYASSGWVEVNLPVTMQVAFSGQDVYIQGLAYFFPKAWIKGTMDGTGRVVFPSGQFVGTDSQGDEYIVGGSATDETSTETMDIVFNYEAESGTLTLDESVVILETGEAESVLAFTYWETLTLTKGGVEVVTPPDEIEAEQWILMGMTPKEGEGETSNEESYRNVSMPLNIIFAGQDVYVQGFSSYLPEAWVKGTLEENALTIPSGQYLGAYNYFGTDYPMFFVGGLEGDEDITVDDVVFYLNTEDNIFETEHEIFVSGEPESFEYFDAYMFAVLQKPIEGPATPAAPEEVILEKDQYGYVTTFCLPMADTNGYALKPAQLSYQLYYDMGDGQETLYVAKADEYEKLDADMSTFAYDFTDGWDIYSGSPITFYLYGDVTSWKRFGVKSMYTANDETHESEITWIELEGEEPIILEGSGFDFNAYDTQTTPYSTSDTHDGDITTDLVIEEGPVTLTVSPSEANTPNRFWLFNTTQKIQLRLYGGSLTFESEEGRPMTTIEFHNGKWNEGNTADCGTLSTGNPATWTGNAEKVVVSIAGNTQLNKIVVTTATPDGIGEVSTTSLSGRIYNLQGMRISQPTQHGVYIIGGRKVVK